MAGLRDRISISQARAQWDRLSARERRFLSTLLSVSALILIGVLGFFVWSGLDEIDDHNAAARQALRDIAEHREELLEGRSRIQKQEIRVSRTPVALAGLLDAAAKESQIAQIEEQTTRPPVPRGKKYVEKGMDLKIRHVTLLALARFLKKLETGPTLIVVDRLLIRSRYNEHDQLDAEIGVLTFEHAPEAPRKADKGDKT